MASDVKRTSLALLFTLIFSLFLFILNTISSLSLNTHLQHNSRTQLFNQNFSTWVGSRGVGCRFDFQKKKTPNLCDVPTRVANRGLSQGAYSAVGTAASQYVVPGVW